MRRGPRRDLIAPIADAVRAAGLRFGVYYSGGLDWHVTDYPALRSGREVSEVRPRDAAYNAYAMLHVRDLIERYRPDVLWNDIEWPDAGKRTGGWSLHELFADYYSAVPDGVVNDRWGIPYADYKTSEYEHGLENESAAAWENCRGIGFSFGFNQIEDERQILTGAELARHLTDVVSRGGRLLLNVGPTAAGEIPAIQQRSLRSLGRWMDQLGHLLSSSRPVDPAVATPSDDPWIRWLETDDAAGRLRRPDRRDDARRPTAGRRRRTGRTARCRRAGDLRRRPDRGGRRGDHRRPGRGAASRSSLSPDNRRRLGSRRLDPRGWIPETVPAIPCQPDVSFSRRRGHRGPVQLDTTYFSVTSVLIRPEKARTRALRTPAEPEKAARHVPRDRPCAYPA